MKQLKKKVITRMMNAALQIDKQCGEQCRDFTVMRSDLHAGTLILRWRTIDISDIDRPAQQFRYECFDLGGKSQGCSIYYSNQEEANAFFESLTPLYHQEYSQK